MSGREPEAVHFVVPEGIDDPDRVSGGNVFDRHVRDGLSRAGWAVRTSATDGPASVAAALAGVPDDGLVLVDGLIAGRSPLAIEGEAERLRIVVLAHMVSAAFAGATRHEVAGERRALRAARAVIATSSWTRDELVRRGLAPAVRVAVATPGAEDAPVAIGTVGGAALLCVGVVAPHKGQDTLVEALSALAAHPDWTCTIAGSLAVHPEFARRIARRAADAGVHDRIRMAGVLTGDDLDHAYRNADLLVAPSRAESYGMVIVDALRRGIPVIASRAGGIPQTVADRAAVLVPPSQPGALRDALREWLVDPLFRAGLAERALQGRSSLPSWTGTVDRVAAALGGAR